MKKINYLLGYKDLKIIQDSDMFQCSLDAVLLANFVTINLTVKRILDIGTGNCPIPLILSTRTNAIIDAVELQKEVYDLAKETVEYNKLNNQINVFHQNIKDFSVENEEYDVIVSNPPYFKYRQDSNVNESDYKTLARHEKELNLEELIKISKQLLKNNGVLSLVHRPERMIDIILEMKKNNIEPKKIQLVYPNESKEANILLIEGRKNGKPGLKILEPIFSHDKSGNYTNQIKKYFS
jgi:tRNA1(Val) A37 N6-methylase TrmN6